MMTRRFLTDPRAAWVNAPTKSMEEWEREVFIGAAYFSVILDTPRIRRYRQEFPTFPEAVADAIDLRDEWGHEAMIYAVNAAGRSFCVDRDKWDLWSQIWATERRDVKRQDR